MKWKGTVDAVLGLRRLAEKSKSKNKKLLVCLLILERDSIKGQEKLFVLPRDRSVSQSI